MAGSAEGEGFWLPSEFLTDDDFLMGKENFNKSINTESESEFLFPTEFPYDFQTEGVKRLEKFCAMSTSPQSTLADGAKYDAVDDLIYLAAGQVARLRLNRGGGLGIGLTKEYPPRSFAQFYPEAENLNPSVFPNRNYQHKQQNEGSGVWRSQQKVYENRGGRIGQAAWTLQQNPTPGRAVSFCGFGGGGGGGGGAAAVKRACAGTGVFLPRRYGNSNDINAYSSDSHRRKTGCSTAPFSGGAAVYSYTKNFDNMNGFAQSQRQSQSQPRINSGFVPDYNSLMARRQAIVLQERRRLLTSLAEGSSMMNRDLFLPQEWTY